MSDGNFIPDYENDDMNLDNEAAIIDEDNQSKLTFDQLNRIDFKKILYPMIKDLSHQLALNQCMLDKFALKRDQALNQIDANPPIFPLHVLNKFRSIADEQTRIIAMQEEMDTILADYNLSSKPLWTLLPRSKRMFADKVKKPSMNLKS